MTKPFFKTESGKLYCGDSLNIISGMDSESVQCCITSPPYWGLRDYNVDGQLGLEKTPELYVSKMVKIFREVRRVLKKDGTLWLNLGDCYATGAGKYKNPGGDAKGRWGVDSKRRYIKDFPRQQPNRLPTERLKQKDLVGIPWRVAFALQSDGWYLRQDIIWKKPNPMPESVTDRCTKSHEYIFLMSKSPQYYFDHKAIKEKTVWGKVGTGVGFGHGTDKEKRNRKRIKVPPGWDIDKGAHGSFHREGRGKPAYSFSRKTATQGKPGAPDQHRPDRENIEYIGKRNKRSVWTVATHCFPEAHFATFPPALILPCILAGTSEHQTVLDPFAGAGTTWLMCEKYNRKSINIDLSEKYCNLTKKRIENETRQLKLFN